MPDGFAPIIEHFAAASYNAFSTRLKQFSSCLDADEMQLVGTVAIDALRTQARLRLNRVLLLELHAAKHAGELTASDEAERFHQFVTRALQNEFAELLDRYYPPLRPRLHKMLEQQREAIEILLARYAADRERLAEWIGHPLGRLTGFSLGLGDHHEGGQTVAQLSFEHGEVMYKPRSLRVDALLDAFLGHVFGDDAERIRVPAVIDRGDYGWAAHVKHRYCDGDAELRLFYQHLGHWLAVLRLFGGTDIHLENLIAAGPVPVVIDVESLFAQAAPGDSSGYGHAHDLAQELIRGSVLRTGIIPFRAPVLGLENVDLSAAGALPGEQPPVHAPVIVGEGTTEARVKIIDVDMAVAKNHPSPQPQLSRYWEHIGDGFLQATERLRRLDADSQLALLVHAFAGCRVRDIRRPTKAYVEIGRMLWHPASLHDEAKAIERARDLFVRNAAVVPIAPSLPQEIAGEIEDLRYGDIPVFAAPLAVGRIDATMDHWRSMRIELEEMAIRSAVVVSELNHPTDAPREGDGRFYFARHPHADQLDARRRRLAAETVTRLLRMAVRGDDGSVTWIAPGASRDGWHVQPLQSDMYTGLGGVAVALAGYIHEVENDRADAVPGVEAALEGALQVLAAMARGEKMHNVGGFTGYGSRLWSWLALYDLLQRPELLAHALAYAEALETERFEADLCLDIIDGSSGAIVPLLHLAEATGDARWLELAARAGRQLASKAIVDEQGARWSTQAFPNPIGGFAHGVAGMAWSLARLALSGAGSEAERRHWSELAAQAFAFQNALFDDSIGNWRECVSGHGDIHTWCGGSVGIGLGALDLYARTGDPLHLRDLRRAVAASQGQWGFSHTLCHGDFSLRELFVRAAQIDPEGSASDPDQAIAQIVSAIEENHGMVGSLTRAAFTPGLMTGLAGAIHGLNRMHPECRLPSPLLLERAWVAG